MNVLATYQRVRGLPLGDWLFARMVALRAPYFGSIGARFTELTAERAEVFAIAMANACELAAGTLCEAATPRASRWIPRGMHIEYRRKAETSVRAVATLAEPIATERSYDVVIPVDVIDERGEVVVHADISMYISPRRSA